MQLKYLSLIIVLFIYKQGLSQGCSDAGFCTMGAINPTTNVDSVIETKNHLKTSVSFGSAQYEVRIINSHLEYDYFITKKLLFSTRITYSYHQGELTSTYGFSDLFLSVSYKLGKHFAIIKGLKIPFNNADATHQNSDLPMSYQTSLGTRDFISGFSYYNKNFSASIGAQIPLTQNNNQFLIENFAEGALDVRYFSANNYIRQPDVLVRLTYHHQFRNKKFVFIGGILPIYHLANDKFTSINNEIIEIKNSKGLTLNLNAITQYSLTLRSNIEFSVGAPIVARKSRPDGLSQFSIGVQYGIKF